MIEAVKAFNARLKKGSVKLRFPESNVSIKLPKVENRKIYIEYFLALDENLEVRGAYGLKYQEFIINGHIQLLADWAFPLTESTIDRKYSLVAPAMLRDALKRQPLLFGLGMGGYQEPLPKMLKAMRWEMFSIPFYFKIIHMQHFLSNITYLRDTKIKRFSLDFIYVTGLGLITIKLFQFFLKGGKKRNNSISCIEVYEFSSAVNDLWEKCKSKYAMIAVRDKNTLNILYPSNSDRIIRLEILENDTVIGWAVVLNTQMSNHKQFGNMRVGSIADCLALPDDASKVVDCATKYLEDAGVDIIVSNQSHYNWCSALKQSCFIKGPSNFIFAFSMELSKLLDPIERNKTKIIINRGDGDSLFNL